MGSRGAQRRLSAAAATAAALILAAQAAAAAPACESDLARIKRADGTERVFHIELADDPAERARGLMGREPLAPEAGMLFVYETEQPVAFWMKDTPAPLDMLFINAAGQVVRVHPRAVPFDETPIPSGAPVRFVLEIAGGQAAAQGLAPGAVLAHPAIAPTGAAWPCR